jgi:hypothetical protein
MGEFSRFATIVEGVSEFDACPSPAGLERSPDGYAKARSRATVWPAGASRGGRPMRCIEVPGGPLQALLVGMPRPAEPVGVLMLEHLPPLLADGPAVELGSPASIETGERVVPRPQPLRGLGRARAGVA